jgi:hypothetical protein
LRRQLGILKNGIIRDESQSEVLEGNMSAALGAGAC